ncbi:MAG: PDZ domain-containing protein [Eubacteriales bacterium]
MEEKDEFSFIQERIKQKPYSRRKLFRRMIITVAMAIIFGLVSCFTFLILEPVFNNWIHPEEKAEVITFPKDENEITLEDIVTSEYELETQIQANLNELEEMADEALALLNEVNQINNYHSLYQELYQVTQEAGRSMVTIESVTSDVDWFNNQYEQKGRISGFIVADNGQELIVIAHYNTIHNQDDIRVTFCNGIQVTATVKQIDMRLQLIALAVPLSSISKETKEEIQIATLGVSAPSRILASPVIAIGSPVGIQNSVMYGMVTSAGNGVAIADSTYQYFTTDMEGVLEASGVIIDLQGNIIGVIATNENTNGKETGIGAIGITELKTSIEKISNGHEIPYVGVHLVDVPNNVRTEQNIPYGAYVSYVEMDSPAMRQGVQSGDIIVEIDGTDIRSSSNYVTNLMRKTVGSSIQIKFMRQSSLEYKEMVVEIEL